MSEHLEVELIPIGSDDPTSIDYDLEKSQSCTASFMRHAIDWQRSALEIKWDASEKVFFVEFTGKSGQIDLEQSDLLS